MGNGYSPAKLPMGRKLLDTLPMLPEALQPQTPDYDQVRRRKEARKDRMKADFDRRDNARALPDLGEGDRVWITDPNRFGRVGLQVSARRCQAHPIRTWLAKELKQ